jgi:hypothetical protein
VSDNNGDAISYFLFRSLVIGAAFGIPGAFFSPTRKVLRLLMNLDAVHIAAHLVS